MNRSTVVGLLVVASSAACALPHANAPDDDSGARADMTIPPDVTRPDVVGDQVISRPDVVEDVLCPAGQTRCGGQCVDTQTSTSHCGACGTVCAAGQECASGSCRAICAAPMTMCGAACVDPRSDRNNCGACGTACTGAQFCSMGACVNTCAQTMCGALCVDTQSTREHCGRCDNACNASRTCTAGACVCNAGTTDCSGTCVNSMTDNNHCGACNNACAGGRSCVAGVCQCPAGQHVCSGTCVSNSSVATCGSSCTACAVPANGVATCNGTACGFTCNAGFAPMGSTCVLTCPAGQHVCGGACVSNNDVATCGGSCTACPVPTNGAATCNGTACGFTCNAGFMPMGSTCVPVCASGQHLCSGACVSNNSVATCGTSCTACPVPANGVATCNGTACGFTCNPGFMAMGSSCVATATMCGNGTIDGSETCDDNNMSSGDGCSMTCRLENNVIREACADTAASIQVRNGQTVRVRGTTVGRTNNGSGSCNATGPEVVLRIRAVDGGTLSVAVTPLAPTWDVVVRAGGGCPGSMCIDSMSPSATETYTQMGVAGGSDIDVVIDGFNGAAGAYDAVIRLM